MDASQFDRLVRSFAADASRRQTLGIALGGLLAALHGHGADAKRKHKKKKKKRKHGPCIGNCQGKTCGSDGCGVSCGDCPSPLICQAGQCVCPPGTDECGGECLPNCPAGTGAAVIVRHPATCLCCIRPTLLNCGVDDNPRCCGEPDSIPCCGVPCDPMAVHQDCTELVPCHYDVECAVGHRCADSPDPRTCDPIPTG